MQGDEYLPFLRRILTSKRLEHSLQVRGVMADLAEIYGLDHEQALVAGLLHDAAKDLGEAEWAKLVAEAGITITHEAERDYGHSLHGPVGAYLVAKELAVSNPLILDAITSHTYYGDVGSFDAPLSWCLRFSDLLEPTRDWSRVSWLRRNVPRLRDAAYGGRLSEAAAIQTGSLIGWFTELGMAIHPNMHRAWAEKSAVLGIDESFVQ